MNKQEAIDKLKLLLDYSEAFNETDIEDALKFAIDTLENDGWIPITGFDDIPVTAIDVWSEYYGLMPSYRLNVYSKDNWFFEPTMFGGPSVVRDATHYKLLSQTPKEKHNG